MNKKIIFLSISMLAILLVGTSFTFGGSATSSALITVFPRGTICGDAQLGHWSVAQFNGRSNYQRLFSLFTVNNMVLSGGNIGTVTSSSGSLAVYNHKGGTLLFAAKYSGMVGGYAIKGSSMYLTGFTAKSITVYLNHITNHGNDQLVKRGTYSNAHVPNQVLPCSVQDALVSFTI